MEWQWRRAVSSCSVRVDDHSPKKTRGQPAEVVRVILIVVGLMAAKRLVHVLAKLKEVVRVVFTDDDV